MRFKIGLALGFAAGYWWASTTDEERRARLDDLVGQVRGNPRVQQVTEAIQARVSDTADRTTEVVTDKVDPAPATTSSGSSSGKSSAANRKAG
jgi:hypothetical protein